MISGFVILEQGSFVISFYMEMSRLKRGERRDSELPKKRDTPLKTTLRRRASKKHPSTHENNVQAHGKMHFSFVGVYKVLL